MADNLTTFMCRLSWNLGASTSWNPQGLSRPVMGLLYLLLSNRWAITCFSQNMTLGAHLHRDILWPTEKAAISYVRREMREEGGGCCWSHVWPQLLCKPCFFPDLTCFPPPVRIVRYGASTCIASFCEASLSHPAPFSNGVLNEGLLPYHETHTGSFRQHHAND